MEFLKGFFRENSEESSSRLVFIGAFLWAALMITFVTVMFYITGKDYSSQIILLVGPVFAFATLNKYSQKGKEALSNPKEQ